MTQTPKIVFVSGASAGFGAAISRRFASAGARVIAAARRIERIESLARELGPSVLPIELDVRDREAVARTIAALPADFAAIDCLINNAGLALGMEPAQRASLDEWDQMVDTFGS